MKVCSREAPTCLNALVGRALLLTLLFTALVPTSSWAQGDDEPHFGIGVSFTPYWKSRSDLLVTMGFEDIEDTDTFEGTEFTIGMVRGRTLGGEWGVSFVRKPFKDTTTVFQDGDSGECGPNCTFSSSYTTTTTFNDVYVRGIEVHWAPSFVTISNRVQIGMNIAGGIAVPEGTVDVTDESTFTTTFRGQSQTDTDTFSYSQPANEVLFGKVPLFKVEAQAAFILAPGFKVKISGGLNNPGLGVRIGATYLFGAS